CPKAGRASETPVAAIAATANDVFFMIQLLVGLKTELGAVIAWSELESGFARRSRYFTLEIR
ncbi:MAG TPA: hypothetical protein VG224_03345, partial [Reyranella sp.]|nr:hypothetical protein [Reyranella sp.]